MSEDKKTDKPETKELLTDAEIALLTSGDSGPLDLQLYRYLKARETIAKQRLAVETEPKKQGQLKEELHDLEHRQSLMVEDGGKLIGNCYRVSALLRTAQQISELPRDEKKLDKPRDDYAQIKRDFELIKGWNGSVEQLATVIPTDKTSSTSAGSLAEEKTTLHQETLEHVFERICSYIFQQNTSITELIPTQTEAFELEVVGVGGEILHPDPNPIATAEFSCRDVYELAEVLEKFSDVLFLEQYKTTLSLLPIYKKQDGGFLLNIIGHRINVWKHGNNIHVKDQVIDRQFDPDQYSMIAEAIFHTRGEFYIDKNRALGFIIKVRAYNPLKAIDEKSSDKPKIKPSSPSYPSSVDILATQSQRRDYENGSLLLVALDNRNFVLTSCLLQQPDIDVNVLELGSRVDSSLWLALKSNHPDIAKKLLEKGADLNILDLKDRSVFNFLLSATVTQAYFEQIASIPAVFNYHDADGSLLHILSQILMDKTATGTKPNPVNLTKLAWLATQQEKMSLSVYGQNILAETMIALFTDYITQEKIYAAVYTAHYFRNTVTFDYKDFVDLYIKGLSPEKQCQALSGLVQMLKHNPDAKSIIMLAAFNYALLNNPLLRDHILTDNPDIINVPDAEGSTPLELAAVEQDEAAVLFLLGQKNIQLTNTLKKIADWSLPTTPHIRTLITLADQGTLILPTTTSTAVTSPSPATSSTTTMSTTRGELKREKKSNLQQSSGIFFQRTGTSPKPTTTPKTVPIKTGKQEHKRAEAKTETPTSTPTLPPSSSSSSS